MQLRPFSVLLLLGAIWGASFLFIKLAVGEINPASLVALRLVIAAVLLVAVLYASHGRLPSTWRTWGDLAFVGLLGVVAPFVLVTWGAQHIPSGIAAILNSTVPLLTIPVTLLGTREERLRGIQVLGILVGFGGVITAVGVGDLAFSSLATWAYLAVLAASLGYAIVNVYSRRAFRGMSPLVPAAGQMVCAALMSVPLALLWDGVPTTMPSVKALGAVMGLAVLGTVVAYILFYWILSKVGAAQAGMVTYIIAPIALVYGAIFLSEKITLNVVIGLGLVIVGIALTSLPARSVAARSGGGEIGETREHP